MKKILTITVMAFSVMLLGTVKNTASAQPYADDDITYQEFYDELDPYGQWMDYPEYGYVWIPDCGSSFRPYSTNGHWVWSDDYDWIWVSDYSWGWAPFHYGRWFYDSYYGWMWVPGYEWSPAWVAWRHGGDYYGWAPLRPGINISINFSIGSYNPPIDYWCFAPSRYITSPRIYDYYVPWRNNVTIINQTTIINNYNYNRNIFRTGPGRRDAERYAGRINPVRFRDVRSAGRNGFRNNEVSVYRPRVRHDNNNRNIAPHKFNRYERNGNNRDVTRRNGNNLPNRRSDANTGRNNTPRQQNPGNNRVTDRRRTNDNGRMSPNNNTSRNKRFERPGTTNRSPDSRDRVSRNNDNRRNEGVRTRPVERNNPVRQNNSRRAERPTGAERNNRQFTRPERNEARNNNRSQSPPRQFNRQERTPSPRAESRGSNNSREQRGNNNSRPGSERRRR